jgi:hypothetical protein
MSNKKLILNIGKRFGKWIIISDKTLNIHNITNWKCLCDCGTEQFVPLNNLMNGLSTQCKVCSAKEGGLKRRKGYEDISGNQWSQIKSQAKRKNIQFNIRIEEAWEIYKLQHEQCAYTGKKLEFSGYPFDSKKNTAVLDRINTKKQFVQYNCQWIHKDIAHIKPQSMSKKEFLSLINDCFTYSNLKNLL